MENFKIYDYSNNLYKIYNTYIRSNIPKDYNVYKERIDNNLIKLLENINLANINSDIRIKQKYQKECLIHISFLDFLFGILKNRNIISSKLFMKYMSKLLELKKMIYTWGSNGEV